MRCLMMVCVTLLITACALPARPDPVTVETVTRSATVPVFQPARPQPLRLEPVRWYVITQDNLNDRIAEVQSLSGGEFVVFAITPKSYENLAGNLQELQRYHRQLLEIVLYYEDATGSTELTQEP